MFHESMQAEPQAFDRGLSSMCTEPQPAAREAAERFLSTNPGDSVTCQQVAALEDEAVTTLGEVADLEAVWVSVGSDTAAVVGVASAVAAMDALADLDRLEVRTSVLAVNDD
jgi:tyrosine decarboxylase / aspartate 1-decarboxylase